MKHLLRSSGHRLMWHTCHALAVVLFVLVVFERLVPGAVLGHLSLFLAVPLLVVSIALHPAASDERVRWWTFPDLWLIAFLCIGRIGLQLRPQDGFTWLIALFATALVCAFLWIFSHEATKG